MPSTPNPSPTGGERGLAAAPDPASHESAPTAEELAAIAADLAQAAVRLAETADALVAAPAAERPALRAALHRWQTLLQLGARRLAHVDRPR